MLEVIRCTVLLSPILPCALVHLSILFHTQALVSSQAGGKKRSSGGGGEDDEESGALTSTLPYSVLFYCLFSLTPITLTLTLTPITLTLTFTLTLLLLLLLLLLLRFSACHGHHMSFHHSSLSFLYQYTIHI